jgi:DNA-binding SARP family transcriptional activator
MEFRILGPLEVVEAEQPIDLGGPRQRALLAILLTRANQVVSRDQLIDALFGEEPREAAGNLVQVYVSRLRNALEPDRERRSSGTIVVTRAPGYLVRVEPDQLDLHRFERLAEDGRRALVAGDAELAVELLSEALRLWRGPALADFAYEAFAATESTRLEELRLTALEHRLEADIARGLHSRAVGELQTLVGTHPLRERLRGLLMLGLYRSGRQAEALDVYQEGRRTLTDDLGLEPGTALRDLERRMLQHDPSLDVLESPAAAPVEADRVVLVITDDDAQQGPLLALAAPLASARGRHELVLAKLVTDPSLLRAAAAALNERREHLIAGGVAARTTALTSSDPAEDVLRLVGEQAVELLLLAGIPVAEEEITSGPLGQVLAAAPCDVAVLADTATMLGTDAPVLVPFGGGEHDWAALELGTWLASALQTSLLLLGPVAQPEAGKRDASRLLSRAALIVQRFAGVAAEPLLTDTGADPVVDAAREASAVVLGLSSRWREEGAGEVRRAIADRAPCPVLLTRRGVRPGGLAPGESLTRFTWSLRDPAP